MTKKNVLESKLRKIIREELYSNSYYKIVSDISEVWEDSAIITSDIYKYLQSCADSGGDELVEETITAITAGINKFKSQG